VISSHRWGFVCIILEIFDKYPERKENAAWSQYYKVEKMSLSDKISRRDFLKNTSAAALSLPLTGLGAYVLGQESHQVNVVNVEVPTRVFKDNKFLDTLTIDDFEVLEDGIPQKLQAMYLINKSDESLKNYKQCILLINQT